MSKKTKHIPDNSVVIILKFDSDIQLTNFISDEDFQLFKSKLECSAVQKGGRCEFFSNQQF